MCICKEERFRSRIAVALARVMASERVRTLSYNLQCLTVRVWVRVSVSLSKRYDCYVRSKGCVGVLHLSVSTLYIFFRAVHVIV